MSNLNDMIATAVVAFTLSALITWPTIARLRRRMADACHRLHHDPLTGLLNRAGLASVHADTRRRGRRPVPLAVLLLDLDGFKTVNDRYGHAVGDELLTHIGRRLRTSAVLRGGVAARLSGDEFVIVLPAHADISGTAEAIGATICAPVAVAGTIDEFTITASIGVYLTETADSLDLALRRADHAMYHAKNRRAGHTVYRPDMAMPRPMLYRYGLRVRDLHRDSRGKSA